MNVAIRSYSNYCSYYKYLSVIVINGFNQIYILIHSIMHSEPFLSCHYRVLQFDF